MRSDTNLFVVTEILWQNLPVQNAVRARESHSLELLR
jgi:hypothetical protein